MKQGFTLLELSIVLVIIGLIIGGITVGQELIRSAELNSTISNANTYKVAVNTFKLKYNAMPGDMDNATAYWGAADSGDGLGADCYAVESTDSATCNGDGSGIVNATSGQHMYQEEFRFWQHLANAELIAGQFTGKTDSTTNPLILTPGKNVPNSPLSGGQSVRFLYIPTGHSNYFAGQKYNTHVFEMGSGLTPQENYNLDVKYDDGSPVSGQVFAAISTVPWSPNCSNGTSLSAEYSINLNHNNCYAFFRQGY